MKLGFMIYSLGRTLLEKKITVPEAFSLMKELGVEGVDLTVQHVEGYTMAQVRSMLEDMGMVVSCNIGGASLTTSDQAARTASLDAIRKVIDNAVELGTSNVLVTTGGCAPGQEKADARANVAAGLAELLPYARQAGVTLSIEDFGSPAAAYQTSAECMECCDLAGPELKITYDSGNMVMSDEDPVSFWEAVKSRVVHAHAKDWELLPSDAEARLISRAGKRYVGTVVGSGVLDYPAIIGAMKAANYDGFLSFEYEGTGDQVAAARQGVGYMKRLMFGAE